MPAKSEKQRRFMGAELARKRAGEETRTDMSEAKLGEFASKEFVMKDALAFIKDYLRNANETQLPNRVMEDESTYSQGRVPREILAQEGIREVVTPANLENEQEILYRRRKTAEGDTRNNPRQLWTTERQPYSKRSASRMVDLSEEEADKEALSNFEDVAGYNYSPDAELNEAQKKQVRETAEANVTLSKQTIDWHGAWVKNPPSNKNVSLNRAILTESRGIARAARQEKERRREKKNSFLKEEAANMNHQDFISQLDGHINHLEKRRMNTPEESRESFDRMYEKEQRQRDFDHDNELRRRKGQPEKPVTHVDRSVKFRDLENKVELQDDNVSQNAEYQAAIASNKAEANARQSEESEDIARREAYSKRNRLADVEIFGTEEDYQDAVAAISPRDKELMESGYPSKVRNIDQPRVVKSKILHSKDLLPAQDSNGGFIPNDTIPFTQETNQLMSLAAAAIEKYVTKEHDDNEVNTKAARRNKIKASKRKMKVSGRGAVEQDRIRGLKTQGKW